MANRFDPDLATDVFLLRRRLPLSPWLAFVAAATVLFAALYHVAGALFGVTEALQHRTTHLVLFLVLVFLFRPLGRASWRAPLNAWAAVDMVLIAAAAGVYAYMMRDLDALGERSAFPLPTDVVSGTVYIALVLEAVRRTVGLALVFVPAAFMLHALFAHRFPGIFFAAPTDYASLVAYLTMDLDGMMGVPIAVASTFIIMFMLFGAVLVRSGAGKFFTDLAYAGAGRLAGGPAKAAVLASGLYGTLSGSTTANVVTSGSFTIPLMKNSGFRPQFAAAVEAIASNGGQFMPPVMGAAAFIIPMYIPGAGYRDVIVAAAVPAVLYYLSLLAMVHFEARKSGLRGLPRSDLPPVAGVLRAGWPLLFSLAIIIVLLLYGFTPMLAGVAALLVTVAVTALRPETRLSPRDLMAALEIGVRNTMPIVLACAAAGLIIGSMNLSGVAGRFSSMIIDIAGGQLWLALASTMLVCIVLGMGMTTTIVYLTLAALMVPSLVEMGASPMAANLFVFYFGALSGVTPPVALTTYAAAGIAGSNPWNTGWEAMKVGLAGFIIPFMFVYTPGLLLADSSAGMLLAAVTAAIGIVLLAAGIQGYLIGALRAWERVLLLVAALLLIHPSPAAGAVALVLTIATQARSLAKLRTAVRPGVSEGRG